MALTNQGIRQTSGGTDAGVTGRSRAWIPYRTLRQDRWWLNPLLVFLGFSAFVVYATIRAFQDAHYYSTPYLSPSSPASLPSRSSSRATRTRS